MAAHGLQARRSTLAKMKTINAGRAFQGSVEDETIIPRDTSGRVLPYAVVDFGTPVKTARDRNLANREKGQPHALPATISLIAGDFDAAQTLMAAYVDLLLDWAPSDSSDSWELKGGWGTRRNATDNTPSRYIEILYWETVVNQNIVA